MAATPQKRWRFYKTAKGAPVVRDELIALGEGGAALTDAMKRLVRGEILPREDEPLTGSGGLRCLRVSVGNNPYRLIYCYEGRRATLALLAVYKNQAKLPKTDLDRAIKRHKDWVARGEAG